MFVPERFVLSKSHKSDLKSRKAQFGSLFGEAVYYRTYSRVKDNGQQETWADTVIRVVEGVMSVHKSHYLKNHLRWVDNDWQNFAHELAIGMFEMWFLPAGRGLWAMGSPQVYERGSAALYNCAACHTKNLCEDAAWTMDMLMNGVGVGAMVDWEAKGVVTPDKSSPQTYTVPDSREGWVSALYRLVNSYVPNQAGTVGPYCVFDYSQIRPAGVQLKTFGGVSSGPKPLIDLLRNVESTLDRFVTGEIDRVRCCADIINFIGCCVVAGNIRRSSEILLCSADDPHYNTFLDLKNYEKNPERGNYGFMSNNSAVFSKRQHFTEHLPDVAKRIKTNGEPGFLNMLNMKKFGRYGEVLSDKADLVNPCVTGDTLIQTSIGSVRADQLVGKMFTVLVDGDEFKSTEDGFWSTGVREVYTVRTRLGRTLTMTSNHRLETEDGSWGKIEDSTLKVGTCLRVYNGGYSHHLSSHLYDEVTHIFESGQQEVFDCSIPGPNKYVSNDLISHNCGEIALEHRETCNLAETFPARCFNPDGTFNEARFKRSLEFATFYCKTVSLLPTHHKSTNAVIARNRRIGVSISGITETIEKLGMTRIITILREGYQTVLKADTEFSTQAGIPTSVRHTTIKPSGSISQLVGVPSGMHFPTFRYAIRRMRVATNSKFCDTLKDSGVPHELEYYRIPLAQGQKEIPSDQYTLYGVHDSKNLEYIEYRGNLCAKITHPETTVFEFPVDLGQAREAKKVSAWEQFALLAMLQREWSDNLVSCTIYYNRDTESDQLEHMLASYAPIVKSVSVLPHTELGDYPQMPYEGIDQETYQKLKDKLGSIDWSRFTGSEGMEPKFCTGETCELNL